MNDYQTFIALSRYARWRSEENRRETWEETVDRYISFIYKNGNEKFWSAVDPYELRSAIIDLEVMPSMRLLMSAGPAAERCNVAAYNCAYLTVDSPRSFDEAMYILMCGTGVGFSVERQYVSQLPRVNEQLEPTNTVLVVEDNKAGWARALRELMSLLYSGRVPAWDLSRLRPAGARLVTFGGRSSGPGPLDSLFTFVVEKFQNAAGRRLNSLECHDIMCKIGEVVVVGGVRRSALISLSNLSDDRMRNAKQGDFGREDPQRYLANNSACYTERPDLSVFMEEWTSLYKSKNGERGIFNRVASQEQANRSGRRDASFDFGTNPCSEIILRPFQFCNLTEVVVRADDTLETLSTKVRLATTLGTIQSSFTEFKYLRKIWKNNCEEERLLGVSLTGILDHATLAGDSDLLRLLKEVAIKTNAELAKVLGINQSVAITCVKPSGTVSQLVDSASGIHPRWSEYYLRTIRGDNKDPMTQFLKDEGIPNEPDLTKPQDTTVFSFPQSAPDNARTRGSLTALEHLKIWKNIQENWCEHKPSITVNIKESEWCDVQAWVWNNWDSVSGISFLPYDDHTYKQAPYQEISHEEYTEWTQKSPKSIDWGKLSAYEIEDTTTGTQELACSAGMCEII